MPLLIVNHFERGNPLDEGEQPHLRIEVRQTFGIIVVLANPPSVLNP